MKRDQTRNEKTKAQPFGKSEEQVAALRELSRAAIPVLTVEDRRERIRQLIDKVSGAKQSTDGVVFPRFLTTATGIEQPQFPPFVRRLARMVYARLTVATYQYTAQGRSLYLTEVAAVRKQSTSELEDVVDSLQAFLRDAVSACCLSRVPEQQTQVTDPQHQVREILFKLNFASRNDIYTHPHPLDDPLRHEALTALLREAPYREVGEKLQEYFWGAAVNVARQFDEAFRQGVDENVFGLAFFESDTATAAYHFFEQHQHQYGDWHCLRHNHELINAKEHRVSDAVKTGIPIPSFVTELVTRHNWLESLLTVVDGELTNESFEEVRNPTTPEVTTSAPPARKRFPPVTRSTITYDPALVLGPYAVLGWDEKSAESDLRLLQPKRSSALRRSLDILGVASGSLCVVMVLVLIWLSLREAFYDGVLF